MNAFLLDVIEQSARRRDKYLHTCANDRKLLANVHPAVYAGGSQVRVLAVLANRFLDRIASSRVGARINART